MNKNMENEIVNYWQKANQRYDEIIQKELKGVKKEAWTQLIEENLPTDENLKILDIGTGPGFFPLLLSEMGHKVTAIDCAKSMLDTAAQNAKESGFEVDFHLMDAQKLDFEDNTFDVIITRNVTWLLRDPMAAYDEWHRVLKPNGRLLIFDGNYYLWLFDEKWKKEIEEDREKAVRAGYKSVDDATREECNRIAKGLFFSKNRRPQWDVPALLNIGFGKIFVDADVSEKICDENTKIKSRTMPLFLIRAQKTETNYLYGLKL